MYALLPSRNLSKELQNKQTNKTKQNKIIEILESQAVFKFMDHSSQKCVLINNSRPTWLA